MARCYGCMRQIEQQMMVCPNCGFDGNHYIASESQLKIGSILNNRYKVGKMLGEGGFGITYIAWDMNLEVPVAVKEYFPNDLVKRDTTSGNMTVFTYEGKKREKFEIGLTKVINEARNMAKFRELQGIVSVIDFFRENGTAYIVMEFVRGLTFKQYLMEKGKIEMDEVLQLFEPLIQSLSQIHKEGIIHRDISPDNIMFNEAGKIRLLDFGAARDYGDDEKSMFIMLKRGYAPEEQYHTKGKQGPWTDVYALCATMYKMMTNVTPNESLDRMEEDRLKNLSDMGVRIGRQVEETLLRGLAVFRKDRIQSMEELYQGLYGKNMRDEKIEGTDSTEGRTCWIFEEVMQIPKEERADAQEEEIGIKVKDNAILQNPYPELVKQSRDIHEKFSINSDVEEFWEKDKKIEKKYVQEQTDDYMPKNKNVHDSNVGLKQKQGRFVYLLPISIAMLYIIIFFVLLPILYDESVSFLDWLIKNPSTIIETFRSSENVLPSVYIIILLKLLHYVFVGGFIASLYAVGRKLHFSRPKFSADAELKGREAYYLIMEINNEVRTICSKPIPKVQMIYDRLRNESDFGHGSPQVIQCENEIKMLLDEIQREAERLKSKENYESSIQKTTVICDKIMAKLKYRAELKKR